MNDLIEQIKKAQFCFIAGNGGSASTAEHFTTDLIKKGYKAICLNSNTSVVTMLANDYGYAYIFSKQLEVLANKEDLLITISCSGKSENILNAQNYFFNRKWTQYIFPTFQDENHKDFGLLEDKHLKICHEVAKQL